MEHHIVFKTVVLGDSGVGKTSLLYRISYFDPQHAPTIGLDFLIRMMDMDGKKIKLTLVSQLPFIKFFGLTSERFGKWDTMGQERFRTITRSFYRGVHGVVLAFDITSRDSFSNLRNWIKDVDMTGGDQMAKIIVGNKLDLKEKRVVSYEEAQDFADTMGIPYFETSAKTALNVEEAFTRLTAEMKRMLDSGVIRMSLNPKVHLVEGRDKGYYCWPCVC